MSIRFEDESKFRSTVYELLPFRFSPLDEENYFLSTDYGEWTVLDKQQLHRLVGKEHIVDTALYFELKAKHFISSEVSESKINFLASKLKTKKSFIDFFSQLHIFVLTIRCNTSCIYCQASRKSCQSDPRRFDMSDEVLDKSIDLFLSMPSPMLTLEFQGGESTLTMPLIKRAIQRVKEKQSKKEIQFVICTNLCDLSEEDMDYLIANDFSISTSLDGPQLLHNTNRKYSQGGAYESLIRSLDKLKEKSAFDKVSALMTTTKNSLSQAKEIIDEYVDQGFRSIFIRELNPYGFAQKYFHKVGYSTEEFLRFYAQCLDYIIELNHQGIIFRESYAALILKKMMTPWATGFVDLQSPCGSGFGVTLYNYDGYIYPSDESRMMAETGDDYFRMGHILSDSREDIFFGNVMQKLASAGVNDSLMVCSDCAFAPYCGAEPVRRYQVTGSIYGHPGKDDFCVKNKSIIKLVINKWLTANTATRKILETWGAQ